MEDTDVICTIRFDAVDLLLDKYITDNGLLPRYKKELFKLILTISTHPKVQIEPVYINYIVSEIEDVLKLVDVNKLQKSH